MSDNNLQVAKQSQPIIFNFFDTEQFEIMTKFCTTLAKSDLVPDMYKETQTNPIEKAIANCMIAVEMSQRMGANHLMVMQNLVIVHGRPSWSSKFLIATVNTCGRFDELNYKFESLGMLGQVSFTDYEWSAQLKKKVPVLKTFDGSQIENIRCTAWAKSRKSKDTLEGTPIDIEMAIKEGWYTKAGSKWQTMPRQMLTYRAASFWTSVYAPDISMGMRTVEESQDIIDIDHEEIKAEAKPDIDHEIKEKANGETLSFDDEKTDPEPDTLKPEPPKDKRPF